MSTIATGGDAYNGLASVFLVEILTTNFMWFVNDGDYIGCYDSCGLTTYLYWSLFVLASYRPTVMFWTMLLRPIIHL